MRFAGCGIVGVAVLLAAGGPAAAQSGHPLHFVSKQCNEDAIALRVDPAPFQAALGSQFTPVLEEGKARVLLVMHDCGQYWMDGESVGPTQEISVWVAIRGVDDVRPVVGAERTLPTRTWFSLFSGSTNPRVREAKTASGLTQLPIESLSLDPPGERRGGRFSLNRDLRYSWKVVSTPPPVRLLGINHDVFLRDSAGTIVMNRIQVIVHGTAGPSPGTLEVVGTADRLPWLPPGTYPATIQTFFPMWSRGTLGLPPPGKEVAGER